ncbi:pilus assembly protein [Rhodobacter lacus]|uniref:Pilus assembly protein n=1 Tax=Rhodobacter lacus TaxID=1641972 RepID=A0ABW5AB28_9RHOB
MTVTGFDFRKVWGARLRHEEGAVTVDWVVLTASIVSLGMIVGGVIWGQSGSLAGVISSYIGEQQVISTFAEAGS